MNILNTIKTLIFRGLTLISYIKKQIENRVFYRIEKIIFKNPLLLTYSFLTFFTGSLLLQLFSKSFTGNFWKQKNFYVFLGILFCGILLEIKIIINNKRKRFKKNLIVLLSSRIFALIPYFWFFVELNKLYYSRVKSSFPLICGPDIEYIIWRFYSWYEMFPQTLRDTWLFLLFYVFLYGVARNRKHFSYFTRYHFGHVTVLGAWSLFIHHVFELIREFCTNTLIVETIAVFIYSFFCLLIIFSIFSIFFGKESNIIFFHQATICQVGHKTDTASSRTFYR